MSRQRKPLSQSTGHNTLAEIAEKERAEELVQGTPLNIAAPAELTQMRERVEWARIVDLLEQIGANRLVDQNNIIAYCHAWNNYCRAVEWMDQNRSLEDKDPDEYDRRARRMLKYSDEVRKFAALCGLTVDSRLKMGSMKVDEERDKIEEMFGLRI